jgi:hypothetical protein
MLLPRVTGGCRSSVRQIPEVSSPTSSLPGSDKYRRSLHKCAGQPVQEQVAAEMPRSNYLLRYLLPNSSISNAELAGV